MNATIDYTHIEPGRRLVATFQPQQWIYDDAVDSGDPIDVDVTDAYLALTPEARASVTDHSQDADELIFASCGGNWPDGHIGPGTVEIESAIEEFHETACSCNDQPCQHAFGI